MELLKLKKIISILFVLLLVGCSKEQSKYTLLFTSDFAYGNDKSYIVSSNQKGHPIKNEEIGGALYYNIINDGEKLILNNGEKRVHIDSGNIIEEDTFDKVLGYLEPKSYFMYKGEPIFIYNTGFIDQENYQTLVQRNDGSLLEVRGLLHCYTIKDRFLYMFLSLHDSNTSDKYHLAKIDMKDMKVAEIVEISNMIKKESITPYGVNLAVINNEMVILFENLNKKIDDINKIQLKTISLNDYSVKEHNIGDFTLKESINYNSFFEFEENIYFITKSNKIFQLQYNNAFEFVDIDIKLPKEIGAFPIVVENDGKIYILEPGSEKYIVEIDIKSKEVSKPIFLDEIKQTKNLYVYSFVVN